MSPGAAAVEPPDWFRGVLSILELEGRSQTGRVDPPDWFRTVLASVGDAVVVTDAGGRVLFMNAVAEGLNGWPQAEALGRPLAEVFRIINEHTRLPAADPVEQVLARGTIVGLANHTLLLARGGAEVPIDDSAAPVRDAAGGLAGAVLVFRDVGERRRLERATHDALAYAEGVIETVREPLVVLDAGLRVRTANRSFYEQFRVSRAETEGRLLHELGDRQWDVPGLRRLLEEVLPRDRHFDDFEVDHVFHGLGRRVMLLNARRVRGRGEDGELILLAMEDVTERRLAARALSVSEARYRRLFETAQDGILILDASTGRITDANPFLSDIIGRTRDELVGRELWEIGLFEDAEVNRAAFRRLQADGYIRYEDLPLRGRDGRQVEVEFVSNVYLVGDRPVIQCNIRDVSDRKRAEAALREAHAQLECRVAERTGELASANERLAAEVAGHARAEAARQVLLGRLATAQEEERHRLARELHDQLGQNVTALILGLQSLRDAAPARSSARPALQRLQGIADQLGREVHHLALVLRPTALDDIGLQAALANYVEDWSERSGVPADFHAAGFGAGRLPPETETALYRVVQEALTNVHKHARARRASVTLHRLPGRVSAVVEDDGAGFDAEAAPGLGRLGLSGMRERLALVGGALAVESSPGAGTSVYARVPLPQEGG
jgi:PAS domain S-box-containing protein